LVFDKPKSTRVQGADIVMKSCGFWYPSYRLSDFSGVCPENWWNTETIVGSRNIVKKKQHQRISFRSSALVSASDADFRNDSPRTSYWWCRRTWHELPPAHSAAPFGSKAPSAAS